MKVSNNFIQSGILFCCYPFFQLFATSQIIFQILILYLSRNNKNYISISSFYLFFISLLPLVFLIFTNQEPYLIDAIRIISLSIPFLVYRLISLEKLYLFIRPLFLNILLLTSIQFFFSRNNIVRNISGIFWDAGIKSDLLARVVPRAFGYWGPAAAGSFLIIFNLLVFKVETLSNSFVYLFLSILIALFTQSKTFLILTPLLFIKFFFKMPKTRIEKKIKNYLIPFFLILFISLIIFLFTLGDQSMTYDFSSLGARFTKWNSYLTEYGNNLRSLLFGVYDRQILKRPDSDILLVISMYGIPYTILFYIFYLNNLLRNNKKILFFIINFFIFVVFSIINPMLSSIPTGIFASIVILSSYRQNNEDVFKENL